MTRACRGVLALGVAPRDRHAVADEAVELAVVLDQRAGEIDPGELLDGLLACRFRQVWVEPGEGRTQVAHEHHVALARPPEGAVRAEGLLVLGVDAVPAEPSRR